MSRKIIVTSGKGGVGKTTVATNLAYRLAKSGARVVAVDGDFGLNNLDVCFGVEGKISYDIFDCLKDRCRVKQAVVASVFHKNLHLLPACFGKGESRVNVNKLKFIVGELARSYDYVIMDCPAGIGEEFRRAMTCAEEALVVTNAHISSIRDADKVVGLIGELGTENVGLIVNRMRGDLSASGDVLSPREISGLLKVKLVGVIPEDDDIACGVSLGGGRSSRAFKILADNVRLKREKVFDCERRYLGFVGSIRRKLKRML